VVRIEVRVHVGKELMAATDDPVFLGLEGPDGREFRLAPAKGHVLRRGTESHFVLGSPDDAATNVTHPELNDPTRPAIDAEAIARVYLRKGVEPIPNVRGLGEMDDRLEVERVEVVVVAAGNAPALRFARSGPLWLGLLCGAQIEIPRSDARA
jgi:hypothetical protein